MNPREKGTVGPRESLSRKLNDAIIASAAQELTGATLDGLRRELADPTQPIDPRRWFSVLEAAYGCNIFLFTVGDKGADPEFAVPKSVMPYIFRPKVHPRTVVIIMRPEPALPVYPWAEAREHVKAPLIKTVAGSGMQCEILGDVRKGKTKPNVDFGGWKFEKVLFDMRERIRTLYRADGKGWSFVHKASDANVDASPGKAAKGKVTEKAAGGKATEKAAEKADGPKRRSGAKEGKKERSE